MSSITLHNQKLQEISTIMVNGYPICKLDYLGSISIHGRHYFHVFRRYNNVYEIVFEDYHGELHFHRDHTVFQSIQRLLCLTDEQMHGLHVISTFSFKHNGSPAISDSFLDMRWSAIQGNWQALMMNLGGILDYHSAVPDSTSHEAVKTEHSTNTMEAMHARLDKQDNAIDYCLRGIDNVEHEVRELRKEFETPQPKHTIHIPDAPEKALRCIPYRRTEDSNGMKRQRLSDRFTNLEHNLEVEFSGSEEEEEEEEDYLELRSGQKYYK